MKQKKFGKKIQNWHRPLGRDQLTHRYLKIQHADPEFGNSKAANYIDPDESEWLKEDRNWNVYDPCGLLAWDNYYGVYGQNTHSGKVDTACKRNHFQLTRLLEKLNARRNLIHVWPDKALLITNDRAIQIPAAVEQEHDVEFVMEHLQRLLADRVSFDLVEKALADADDLYVLNRVEAELENPGLMKLILLLSPLWVRRPSSWQKGSARSLIEHLFVTYDVPAFLYSEWFVRLDRINFQWICWFLILAQGGSLSKASKYQDSLLKQFESKTCQCEKQLTQQFYWSLSKRFQQHLFDLPETVSPLVACIIAEIKRLGGSEKDYQRLLQHTAFVVDVTRAYQLPDKELRYDARFWRETVRWLIKHRDEMTDEECYSILNWARHAFTEDYNFSLKRRNVSASLANAREYEQSINAPWQPYQWERLGLDWYHENEQGDWHIQELITSKALYIEGQVMQHCVADYVYRCSNKDSAIFSLRKNNKRCLTIELDCYSKGINQALGKCNRDANQDELAVLRVWQKWIHEPVKKETRIKVTNLESVHALIECTQEDWVNLKNMVKFSVEHYLSTELDYVIPGRAKHRHDNLKNLYRKIKYMKAPPAKLYRDDYFLLQIVLDDLDTFCYEIPGVDKATQEDLCNQFGHYHMTRIFN